MYLYCVSFRVAVTVCIARASVRLIEDEVYQYRFFIRFGFANCSWLEARAFAPETAAKLATPTSQRLAGLECSSSGQGARDAPTPTRHGARGTGVAVTITTKI